ncbi:lish domain-containing protein fopnl [Anaeramoeba flamelloides]|uniref:Lish domain-containing protein fopnl n=1 Tax=Anaeramoeba flamelloides TaxID=1746091 RepID=A0AAV7Y3H5_9EUKA|nr:lish domain-containing protein fopnl [Anaeramoeba flamelloides]
MKNIDNMKLYLKNYDPDRKIDQIKICKKCYTLFTRNKRCNNQDCKRGKQKKFRYMRGKHAIYFKNIVSYYLCPACMTKNISTNQKFVKGLNVNLHINQELELKFPMNCNESGISIGSGETECAANINNKNNFNNSTDDKKLLDKSNDDKSTKEMNECSNSNNSPYTKNLRKKINKTYNIKQLGKKAYGMLSKKSDNNPSNDIYSESSSEETSDEEYFPLYKMKKKSSQSIKIDLNKIYTKMRDKNHDENKKENTINKEQSEFCGFDYLKEIADEISTALFTWKLKFGISDIACDGLFKLFKRFNVKAFQHLPNCIKTFNKKISDSLNFLKSEEITLDYSPAKYLKDDLNFTTKFYWMNVSQWIKAFISCKPLRESLIYEQNNFSNPDEKNFEPQEVTSTFAYIKDIYPIMKNKKSNEEFIIISFFIDGHRTNKTLSINGFYFFIENIPVCIRLRYETIYLISNTNKKIDLYQIFDELPFMKDLKELSKNGIKFKNKIYRVIPWRFFADSPEANKARMRGSPTGYNSCAFCKTNRNSGYYNDVHFKHLPRDNVETLLVQNKLREIRGEIVALKEYIMNKKREIEILETSHLTKEEKNKKGKGKKKKKRRNKNTTNNEKENKKPIPVQTQQKINKINMEIKEIKKNVTHLTKQFDYLKSIFGVGLTTNNPFVTDLNWDISNMKLPFGFTKVNDPFKSENLTADKILKFFQILPMLSNDFDKDTLEYLYCFNKVTEIIFTPNFYYFNAELFITKIQKLLSMQKDFTTKAHITMIPNVHLGIHGILNVLVNGSIFCTGLALEQFHKNFKTIRKMLSLGEPELFNHFMKYEIFKKYMKLSLLHKIRIYKDKKIIQKEFAKNNLYTVITNRHIFHKGDQIIYNRAKPIYGIIIRMNRLENNKKNVVIHNYSFYKCNSDKTKKYYILNGKLEIMINKNSIWKKIHLIPIRIKEKYNSEKTVYIKNKYYLSHTLVNLSVEKDRINLYTKGIIPGSFRKELINLNFMETIKKHKLFKYIYEMDYSFRLNYDLYLESEKNRRLLQQSKKKKIQ